MPQVIGMYAVGRLIDLVVTVATLGSKEHALGSKRLVPIGHKSATDPFPDCTTFRQKSFGVSSS